MLCFDGHNDLLFRLWETGDPEGAAFLASDGTGHIDLARARHGGFCGGLFALFAPSQGFEDAFREAGVPDEAPRPAEREAALRAVLAQASILHRMERSAPDALRVCRTVEAIETAGDAVADRRHFDHRR
ncbi:MAG: membrane dipeptidase [Pseudomonadota bacterium]